MGDNKDVKVWGCSLVLAVLANLIFWGQPYGLSVLCFALACIASSAFLVGKKLLRHSATFVAHLLLILLVSAVAAIHRNAIIDYATIPAVFCLLAALPLAATPAYSFQHSFDVIGNLVDVLHKGVRKGLENTRETRIAVRHSTSQFGPEYAAAFKGFLAAVPFLVVFGGLFASADPIFEGWVAGFWNFLSEPNDTELSWRALCVIGQTLLVALFLLEAFLPAPTSEGAQGNELPNPSFINPAAGGAFTSVLAALFALFIVIQLQYLWGGDEVIRHTSLTYAEYARRGFGALLVVLTLVGIILLALGELTGPNSPYASSLRVPQAILIFETFVILASAQKRIWVYQQAYGWTYLRVLVALFELWVGTILVLLLLRLWKNWHWREVAGRGLSIAFGFLLVVSLFSLDAFIARQNVARSLEGRGELDTSYLESLSVDTVPELERLRRASADENIRSWADARMAELVRESGGSNNGWCWNYSVWRACRLMQNGNGLASTDPKTISQDELP